jgi:hypothetical protein
VWVLPPGAATECGWAHDEAQGLWTHAASGFSCRHAPPPRKLKAQLKAAAAAAAEAAVAATAALAVAAAASATEAAAATTVAAAVKPMNRKAQRRMRALSRLPLRTSEEEVELQALLARVTAAGPQ